MSKAETLTLTALVSILFYCVVTAPLIALAKTLLN